MTKKAKQAWAARAGMPYKVQEIYSTVLDGKIHVAGGFLRNESGMGVSPHHMVYDPDADTWAERAPLPAPRHHPQLVAHRGKVYALGGFEATGPDSVWGMQAQTWIYDPAADAWADGPAAPEVHAETVAVSLGDRIHLVGGREPVGKGNQSYGDHIDTDRHLVFDPSSGKWDTAAPALSKRNSAAGAVLDGRFYVVGGRTIETGNVSNLEIYDPQEDKWYPGSPMPQAQGGLAAEAIGGRLYALGGEYFNNGGGVYAETWQYDSAKDKWDAFIPMRTPRHGLSSAVVGEWLYAIGGACKPSGEETSNILERIRIE